MTDTPSETLKELLEVRGVDTRSFSNRSGIPVTTVEGILDGNGSIDKETAIRIQRFFGNFSVEYWLALEKRRRKAKKNLKSLNQC